MKYLKTFKFISEQLIYTSNMDEYADELKKQNIIYEIFKNI